MRGGQHDSLSRARFVLRKDIHQVAEVTGKLPGSHGSTHFQSALEGNSLHIKPFFLEESFVDRYIKHDGVGRG